LSYVSNECPSHLRLPPIRAVAGPQSATLEKDHDFTTPCVLFNPDPQSPAGNSAKDLLFPPLGAMTAVRNTRATPVCQNDLG